MQSTGLVALLSVPSHLTAATAGLRSTPTPAKRDGQAQHSVRHGIGLLCKQPRLVKGQRTHYWRLAQGVKSTCMQGVPAHLARG